MRWLILYPAVKIPSILFFQIKLSRATYPGAPSYGGLRSEDMDGELTSAQGPRVGWSL